jgi:uncharacterized membrane protein YesL
VKRISHDTFGAVIGVAYLGLMTNLLLVVAASPLVVLLMTSDPAASWPLLAIAAPICAPGLTAAFTVFRDHKRGGTAVVRSFLAAWRATWRKAMTLGAIVTAVIVVVLVDVRFFATGPMSVVVVPALAIVALVAAAVALVGLVAIAEEPSARLRVVLKASLYLAVRRWYLTVVSLILLALQFALFTTVPAIALGVSMAPALYLAWANSRYTLAPVLHTDEVTAS